MFKEYFLTDCSKQSVDYYVANTMWSFRNLPEIKDQNLVTLTEFLLISNQELIPEIVKSLSPKLIITYLMSISSQRSRFANFTAFKTNCLLTALARLKKSDRASDLLSTISKLLPENQIERVVKHLVARKQLVTACLVQACLEIKLVSIEMSDVKLEEFDEWEQGVLKTYLG